MTLRKPHDSLEKELRRNRVEPRPDFLNRLVARMSHERPAAATRLQIALAGALTAVLLVTFAAFGGVGYAASAVSEAVQAVTVKHPTKGNASKTRKIHGRSKSPRTMAADDQYKPGCGKGDENHVHDPGQCPPK